MNKVEEILEFWFGRLEKDDVPSQEKQKMWWKKDKSVDNFIKKEFEGCIIKAVSGDVDDWLKTPKGMLAFIIVLDQFSRNIYRDIPKAFSQDKLALRVCLEGIKKGFDKGLHPVARMFFYMPFMHSEDLEDQKKSLERLTILEEEFSKNLEIRDLLVNSKKYAQMHFDIIERFRRYPHRNRILGRVSTPEEIEFLKQPGSSF